MTRSLPNTLTFLIVGRCVGLLENLTSRTVRGPDDPRLGRIDAVRAQVAAARFHLAGGRPVVSTPIADVIRHYGDMEAVFIADGADAFVTACRDVHKLPIVGLMCIPPVDEEPALHFALLAKMAARNGLSRVSMGMSADYETAVRLGATHVRVGTALFGSRGT